MPRILSSLPLRALPLLLGLFLTSCISVGDFSRSATRYNEAVEEAQNRMLLLNVVRSDLHRPMYITDLSKVTGNIKLDLNTGGIETDYGPYANTLIKGKGALTSGKLTPSLDYAHNPTFDVNVLSQQDFMNGFLKPTSKETVAYYWEQRWEQELLLYLFVHSVRVRSVDDTAEPEEYYENYPIVEGAGEVPRLEAFGQWVTKFLETKPLFVRRESKIGPCLERNEVNELDDLVMATKEGLSLAEVEKDRYQLQQAKPELSLESEEQASLEQEQDAICKRLKEETSAGGSKDLFAIVSEAIDQCAKRLAGEGDVEKQRYISRVCGYRKQIFGLIKDKKFECASPCPGLATDSVPLIGSHIPAQYQEMVGGKSVKKEATLFLRSPEGILYYLGELMRIEEQEGIVPEICIEGKLEPLFVAFARSGAGYKPAVKCPATVSVQYDGSEFIIPETRVDSRVPAGDAFQCVRKEKKALEAGQNQDAREAKRKYLKGLDNLHCSPGRSMQALSLLTQLIALQKSAKDAPTTTVIRAISQ